MIQGVFLTVTPLKKLKYGKPRFSESRLTQIGLNTPNLAKINFLVLGTFKGGASEEKTPCKMQIGLVEELFTSSCPEQVLG